MQQLLILYSLLISFCTISSAQQTNIYLFPGQGSDSRLFDSLSFDSVYSIKYMDYPIPEKGTSMKQFAYQLAKEIDTTQPFVLIGVSLGGMLCVEISEILNPEKVIIVSSAKNRSELPFRYKFQKAIPIYKLIPAKFLHFGARILQPIVEPDRKHNKETFKQMLAAKNPKYIKRTIEMIVKWDRKENNSKIRHIHGTKDHTLPIRKVKCDVVVINGSHMMTLTRGSEITELLKLELER